MRSHTRLDLAIAVLLSLFLVMLTGSQTLAQLGRWVEHPLPAGSGGDLFRCGDQLLVHTQMQSNTCSFYDARHSCWVDVSLGAAQNFQEVLASGDVAMARADSLLVAYSAQSGTWDTAHIAGSYIALPAYVTYRLAAAFTGQVMYVFDGYDGTWHQRPYTPPPDFTGYPEVLTGEDYVVLILPRLNGLTYHVVYSYPEHAFNSLNDVPAPFAMDGGYVAIGIDPNFATLIGYSAQTNAFSTTIRGIPNATALSWAAVKNTGTSCGFVYTEYLNGLSRQDHYYCYDTKLGNEWYYGTRYFEIGHVGNASAIAGDRFVAFPFYTIGPYDAITTSYIIYSGFTGGYVTRPDRTLGSSGGVSFIAGSTCFLAVDSIKVWVYDVATAEEHIRMIETGWATINIMSQRDFSLFVRYNPMPDTAMAAYAYCRYSGEVQRFSLPSTYNTAVYAGQSTAVLQVSSNPPALAFYSPQQCRFERVDHSSGSAPSIVAGDVLAFASVGSDGYLFDAVVGTLANIPADLGRIKMGNSAFLYWDAARVAHGYSVSAHAWSTTQMDADGSTMNLVGWIGLIPANLGVTLWKYYAYNGLHDGWVPLVPSGTRRGVDVGDRVGLVVHSTMLYAFDPELATGVVDQEGVPGTTILEQNYPNPFNPATTIRYRLAQRSAVQLAIFNTLGQQVATLVHEHQEAGYHEARFEASNLASGVYYCRLRARHLDGGQTGEFLQTRKLVHEK